MDNQIFLADRFSAYFKKYVVEKRNSLLISIATLFFLAVAFCLGWPQLKGIYSDSSISNFVEIGNVSDPMWSQELFFYSLMWFFTTFLCADFYSVLCGKKERIAVFTCPASNLEKFLTYFIIYAVALPVILILSFLIGDAIRVWVYSAMKTGVDCIHYISPKYLLSFGCASKYWEMEYYISAIGEKGATDTLLQMFQFRSAFKFSFCLFGPLLLQSLIALGSAVWTKKSLFKTICFLLAMGILQSILFFWGVRAFYGNTPIEPRGFSDMSGMTVIYIYDAIAIAAIIFNWALAYVRFQEWEVIKRW